MNNIQRNLKATSLLNISLGLFLTSAFLEQLLKGVINVIGYIGLGFAIVLVLLGLYNYFIAFKDLEIIPDKRYGYLSLVIGILFLISTSINITTKSLISVFLGNVAGVIALILSFILLKKSKN